MPVQIHLIRHAQGVHNIGNHSVRDATLTPLGNEQCEIFAGSFPFQGRVKTIVVSPLRRAIYTAVNSLRPAITKNHVQMIANPLFQETGHAPCDTGLEAKDLIEELRTGKIDADTTLVVPGWNSREYGSPYVNTSLANSMRAKLARRFLRDLVKQKDREGDDSDIAVVSHGGFLHYLTEDWEGAQGHESVAWKNTEYRTFTIAQIEGDLTADTESREQAIQAQIANLVKPKEYSEMSGLVEFIDDVENATLVETPESRQRRGASPVSPLSRDDQQQLWFNTVSKWQSSHVAAGWEKF